MPHPSRFGERMPPQESTHWLTDAHRWTDRSKADPTLNDGYLRELNQPVEDGAGTEPRRRILVVSHSALRHGAEMALLRIIDHLAAARRFEFSFVVPVNGEYANELRRRGFKVHVVPYPLWVHRTP